MSKIVIDNVPEERWKEAQDWEEHHWVNAQRVRKKFFKNHIWKVLSWFGKVPKYRGDDWNSWWMERFDGYKFLPAKIGNALEAGCGPYTNMRMIKEGRDIAHIVLSDPLIRTYAKFEMTFVSDLYAKAECMLDDHPLEELPFRDDFFDLVVKINVLDHVRDARECMANLVRVTKPGGIIIIGQDLTNEEDMEVLKRDAGAVGHPIKLDAEWFAPYFEGFEPIIDKVLTREEGRDPSQHFGTLLFAGRKRQG